MRAPLRRSEHLDASGVHQGIETANVPWEIFAACCSGEAIDVQTYVALHTTIDLAGLLDILEMAEVHQSWAYAAMMNAREADASGNPG